LHKRDKSLPDFSLRRGPLFLEENQIKFETYLRTSEAGLGILGTIFFPLSRTE
jgi:hypothetical protein